MRIIARQHIPNFVDTDTRNRAEVSSVEELLAVPWIASWAKSWPDHDITMNVTAWPDGVETHTQEQRPVKAQTFHRWSIADPHNDPTLMAEFDNGDRFWVVAYLRSDEPIPLPEWHETENARLHRERWNRGEID